MTLIRNILLAAVAATALSGAARAADLAIPAAAPAPAAPESTWDGLYFGIFGGYAGGTLETTDPFLGTSGFTTDYSGYFVGVDTGYNFHLTGTIVGGFGVDIAYNNGFGSDDSYTEDLAWTGAVTGRIGADLNGIVPYLVGGVAVANASITDRGAPDITDTQTHVGYTVGAGVEFNLTDNVSADVEYRYTDYGARTYTLTNPTFGTMHDNSVRFGLNYHVR